MNTTIRTLWPRQYFTSEWRQAISGEFMKQDPFVARSAENVPKRAVCGLSSNHMDHLGYQAESWWTAARDNSYVALYCTVQTSDDFSERRDNRCQVRFLHLDCTVVFVIIMTLCCTSMLLFIPTTFPYFILVLYSQYSRADPQTYIPVRLIRCLMLNV